MSGKISLDSVFCSMSDQEWVEEADQILLSALVLATLDTNQEFDTATLLLK